MAARKLKVFQTRMGFYDTIVAAASQAAALRAWGINQNLFASGEAKVTTDAAAVEAATAYPDTPLRRAVGSNEPFVLEPTSLPSIPAARKRPAPKPAAKPKPAAPSRPPPDRSALTSAEQALAALDDRRKREEADLRREEEAMKERRGAAQAAYVEARKAAASKVAQARAAYRQAGGAD